MSLTETKICQNCKKSFVIDAADFDFYKKIQVPSPTFCPDCRMQRRFSWRNERTFHRNTCAKTGKPIISGFAPDSGYAVYDRDVWWSDDWDPLASGADYDFSKPFFTQFDELMHRTPQPSVFNGRTTNCAYSNHVGEMKNGYLVSASWGGENLAYSSRCQFSKDCMDTFGVSQCELCYELVSSIKCYNTFFSQNCEACTDSMFLFDCKGCSHCVGCVNLRSKNYYILNEPYSKEEYFKKLSELRLDTAHGISTLREKFSVLKMQSPHRCATLINCRATTGESIWEALNCASCFDMRKAKDCKYIVNAFDLENVYDGYGVGATAGLIYEAIDTGDQGERMLFDVVVWSSTNALYSYNCSGCQNIFGCVGLRNKQNCILNRQYSKEKFEKMRAQIIEHMSAMPYVDRKGREYRYGEFFPTELSPFGYNETVAQEYFSLSEADAKEKGFSWRNPEPRHYTVTKKPEELPESIEGVSEGILKEVIGCTHSGECNHGCTTAFRIVPQELQFYKRLNLPLPKLCPNCRHYARLTQRNPLKLWKRKCVCNGATSQWRLATSEYKNTAAHSHGNRPCSNEFETSYAPERPEIVYCESCYQSEVA